MAVVIDGTNGVSSPDYEVDGVTGQLYPIVSGTAVTASGTAVNFTSIPSWVKRITVLFSGVSTSGTSAFLIQLGDSGGIENTGYTGSGSNIGTGSTGITGSTAGFILVAAAVAANNYQGKVEINLADASTNTWVSFGTLSRSSNDSISSSAGTKSLSDTLTQVRITTVNGTDTFDAGTINILYE